MVRFWGHSAILALTVVAAPASAEPIWGGVELGMSRAQVEELYPAKAKVEYQRASIEISDVPITERCQAEVNIRFDQANLVREIMIAGNPSMGGRCSNDVLASLSAKYGQPANWDGAQQSILAREGKVAIWARPGGISMRFKKFTNGPFGGGGLAKSSWELSYTAADRISL